MIPHRIRLSKQSTSRLAFLKSKTGLTPNILSRFAFVLSIRNLQRVTSISNDSEGQEFNTPTLFGEYQRMYELLLTKYIESTNDKREIGKIVSCHIENGLFKMNHIRSLQDVASLQ